MGLNEAHWLCKPLVELGYCLPYDTHGVVLKWPIRRIILWGLLSMKLVTFRVETPIGWVDRLGAVAGEVVIDLNATYAWYLNQQGDSQPQHMANALLPSDMRGFLNAGARAMENARILQELYKHHEFSDNKGLRGATMIFNLADITLQAPVNQPNVYRDFYAFEEHVETGFARRHEAIPEAWYELPVYYKGNHRSIIGPEVTVPWPSYTQKLDYELELACVIGKTGQNIPEQEASHYIAGYMILNDISARDIQKKEMSCRLGPAKAKDFCTVTGPWLVTTDEVGDAYRLAMTADINGERWSAGNSSTIHYTFEKMIAFASQHETLYPGDIIGSGTVGTGCGLELNRWIQPGDTMSLTIDKLGTLNNTVGQPLHKYDVAIPPAVEAFATMA